MRTLAIFLLFSIATPTRAQISADLDLRPLIDKVTPRVAPKVTCGITTVGYRFVGPQGRTFRYSGVTYAIDSTGYVELIANPRRTTFAHAGRSLPLNVWPLNEFGFRQVTIR